MKKPTYNELVKILKDISEDIDEGQPRTKIECDIMIVLWKIDGDRLEPCEDCDGDCGESCAPTTAANAIGGLEAYSLEKFGKI